MNKLTASFKELGFDRHSHFFRPLEVDGLAQVDTPIVVNAARDIKSHVGFHCVTERTKVVISCLHLHSHTNLKVCISDIQKRNSECLA